MRASYNTFKNEVLVAMSLDEARELIEDAIFDDDDAFAVSTNLRDELKTVVDDQDEEEDDEEIEGLDEGDDDVEGIN